MSIQFTHPSYLLLLPVALGWLIWWFRASDVQSVAWRRRAALSLRLTIVLAAILALAGLQWKRPLEGMNVFFLLDRSDSIPSPQQEAARLYVNQAAQQKKEEDRVGVLVFGSQAALESSAASLVRLDQEKVLAVVDTERTDLAAAIRLGTAAFPDVGQKRLVLISDGNENLGDAVTALMSARSLGISLDVIPVGTDRPRDTSIQKLGLPGRIRQGATFETKIFLESDVPQRGLLRLYRNNQILGEETVDLAAGKNLFSFPQQLDEPGFYNYSAVLETEGDNLPQNNQATGFVQVRGEPQILIISGQPEQDQALAQALRDSDLKVDLASLNGFPRDLAALTAYDSIFLSNSGAGDLGEDVMNLLESAVRDFGVGLVCIGGENTYAAGGYRSTPLEALLPVDMELDSKKVLPNGAVVLIMHGMEFNNGNQIARDCALGVLDSLGPQDELGVLLWDGREQWLFELTQAGNKSELGGKIAGMNQGDLISFQNVMAMAHQALAASTANIKHIIVFSDGDPGRPAASLMTQIVDDRITVSTVLISGHAGPETMEWMALQGNGRFYDVADPYNLPQIFLKEAAVILKAAIIEEPFQPQLVFNSEVTRGFGENDFPQLLGYVGTSPKTRAEVPLLTHKGDPLLAHWQYGLGRSAAFTSDARARWGRSWLSWNSYRQFWSQVARWSLRRVAEGGFSADASIEDGQGRVVVEALDPDGDYRNFLNLQAAVVNPKGERQMVRLEQTGPGRYEASFPTPQVGAYLLNLQEIDNGQVVGAEIIGTSINYSPEFKDASPNLTLLKRLAELGGGRVLDPTQPGNNPFQHNRIKTFQPRDLWPFLLQAAILLFVLDIALRRIQLEREQWAKAWAATKRVILFWKSQPRPSETDESLAALLARRDQIRRRHIQTTTPTPVPDLLTPRQPAPPITTTPPQPKPEPEQAPQESEPTSKEAPASTASRLLEAKRRARKKME